MFHYNGEAGIDTGWIIAETGCMYSGKTTTLIGRIDKLRRIEQVRKNAAMRDGVKMKSLSIGCFKHAIDKRYDALEIVSHTGVKLKAMPVTTVDEIVSYVVKNNYRVVAIDEIQFFDEKDEFGNYKITSVLKRFADENRLVIVAGLDKDFRGLPFGPMGDILAIADEKSSHTSTCAVCGGPATLPQRLINNEPAYFDDPVVMVGAAESYEPRCRKHHIVRQKNKNLISTEKTSQHIL